MAEMRRIDGKWKTKVSSLAMVIASAAAGSFTIVQQALAADLPSTKSAPEAPIAASDPWSGFYLGGHVGETFGTSRWTATGADAGSGVSPAVSHDGQQGPLNGGYQVGWNHLFASRWLIGVEGDITFPDLMAANQTFAGSGAVTNDQLQFYASARVRLGYAFGNVLPYVTGGFALSRDILTNAGAATSDQNYLTREGYAAGAGVELRLSPLWSAKVEYVFDGFPRSSLYFANVGQTYSSNLGIHNVTAGLNYHFGADEGDPGLLSNMDNWSFHAQTTAIYQASLPFHATYSGPQSLQPVYVARDTNSVTGYVGYRFQPGTEIWFNPEPFQGFGLDSTHGLGGFSNGEAQKGGYPFPHYNTARLFVRETYGLGGEQEDIDDAANQFGGKQDISRFTFTFGRMSATDTFDNNAYSHDPRGQFLNFSLMDAGALDYAADQKGYTWGAVAELNQKTWAIRAGAFLEPTVPNGNNFEVSLRGIQEMVELEERYSVLGQAGKLRLLGFIDWANSGVFADYSTPATSGLICSLSNPTNCAHHLEYGFDANLEHALSENVGLFSRLSWRNGQTTIMAWTDIDKSVQLGTQLKGALWGRPDDIVGVAGVLNGLSKSYQNFLGVGGLGINIGDGALNYSGEKIVESYYQINVTKWSAVTFDYQFIGSPAYNSARGPANILSARFHAQF
jgi:high affinity Mn2+ porin